MLICGVYGLEKSNSGILIYSPKPINGVPLTELRNICWRKAIYNFTWEGKGSQLAHVFVDGKKISSDSEHILLTMDKGIHEVKIVLKN
jgi:hypothetical protein